MKIAQIRCLLNKLNQERSKFTESDKDKMQKMIDILVAERVYPSEPTPAMKKHGYSLLTMVESWGVDWYKYDGAMTCPSCFALLIDEKNGPPFKKEIGIYSIEEDRTIDTVCPECYKSINSGKQYENLNGRVEEKKMEKEERFGQNPAEKVIEEFASGAFPSNEYPVGKKNGFSEYRFNLNPAEKIIAEEWVKNNEYFATTKYLLSDTVNKKTSVSPIIEADINTVIQWLGSPCGQAFLKDVKERCKKEGVSFLGE